MDELQENCKVCELPLKPKEYSSENLAHSKDKTRIHYICNKCRKKLLQMHEQANMFIAKDVFWGSVRK